MTRPSPDPLDNSDLVLDPPPEVRLRGACLCLHGLGGGPYEVQPLTRALARHGYRVMCRKYPGHTGTGDKMPPSRWEQWYEFSVENVRELRAGLPEGLPLSYIGSSTGCPLAVVLAHEAPPARLVLLPSNA